MDPYACIELRKTKYKTKTIRNGGKLPNWNENFLIPIMSLEDDILISCFDEDLISDDLIGQSLVKVNTLIENSNTMYSLPLYYKLE